MRFAERMRAGGHQVITPDLYGGRVASTIDEGFALSARIGWAAIMGRARDAVADLPDNAVLAGFSMGVGVVGDLIADRRNAAGLLLFHGTGGEPAAIRPGLPIGLHIADGDEFFPLNAVETWTQAMREAGATVDLHTYPNVRHFFTDPQTPDYDEPAASLAQNRSLAFLSTV